MQKFKENGCFIDKPQTGRLKIGNKIAMSVEQTFSESKNQ